MNKTFIWLIFKLIIKPIFWLFSPKFVTIKLLKNFLTSSF